MSLLPTTTRKSSGGSKGGSRHRYRALILSSVVLVFLTLLVDKAEDRATQRAGNGHTVESNVSAETLRPLSHLKSLVLVACHSVYTGLRFDDPEDTSAWALLEYQKSTEGQTHSFIEHILLGVEEAAKDSSALLLFSGGQTRSSAGPRAYVYCRRSFHA